MRVLVACEYSGRVRDSFSKLGWDAWSCDFEPTETAGQHYQGDVKDMLSEHWDLMIAHPPCTYLSVSGMHWTTRGMRDPKLTEDALDFVRLLMNANVSSIAIENPISVISTKIRKPNQIIQPWQFGENASKKTCLWLKNLPKLITDSTKIVPPRGWNKVQCIELEKKEGLVYTSVDGILFSAESFRKPVWDNQTDSGQNKLTPSAARWKERSRTYQGIASTMADQWNSYLNKGI